MRKIASLVLIIVGLVIIGAAALKEVSTIYNHKKLIEEYIEYENIIKNMGANEIQAESDCIYDELDDLKSIDSLEESQDEVSEAITKDMKTEEEEYFENKSIRGLIEIPKIKVVAAILEGADDSALKYAVGHYPGLGEPGKSGNYVLLGHRNYVYGHFFRNLDKLEVGDEVKITVANNVYTYTVYESFVVKPEDVWVLEQTKDSIVTMITCTPIGTYEDRLIVRGALKH